MLVNGDYGGIYSARWYTEDGGQSGELQPTPPDQSRPCMNILRNLFDHENAAVFHEGALYYSHFYSCEGIEPQIPTAHLRRWASGLNHEFARYVALTPNITMPGALVVLEGNAFFLQFASPVIRIDLQTGERRTVRDSANSVQVTANGFLVAGSGAGLYLSPDLGESWQPAEGDEAGTGASILGPAAFFDAPVRWLAAGLGGVSAASTWNGPWSDSSRGLALWSARALAVDPANENRIWSASSVVPRVLTRTSESGATWQRGDIERFDLPLASIVVDPATTTGNGDSVLHATGGGCVSGRACQFDEPNVAGIFRSHDSGGTWEMIAGNLGDLRNISLRNIALVRLSGMQQPRLLVTGQPRL